jgi:hypothetical protein
VCVPDRTRRKMSSGVILEPRSKMLQEQIEKTKVKR